MTGQIETTDRTSHITKQTVTGIIGE